MNFECIIDNSNITINKKNFKKMIFILNAIDNGWTVKKQGEFYSFKKKHDNKQEIFSDNYIEKFISANTDITKYIDTIFGLEM